ncbi:uncharacterized protein LOC106176555 [Lingula anatina]|uniref:Uncharacterized protein LOC106176555 n=1 Tax=Lingula anatina TaxID=7574 RepID=A0A1S3JVP0_LINAN|nr:uncharacterized protein LOC106176555 [Lingula anatina]|eukprot:XP_013414443.1 uncharacterized protein LOC106176555 [Lingula anatina]
MDWNSKFSNIVRETEESLSRVKQRLGSARATTSSALAIQSPTFSPTVNAHTESYRNTREAESPRVRFRPSTWSRDADVGSRIAPLDQSPAVVLLLQDKIEEQGRTIEHLTRTVKRLEQERNQNKQELTALRDDMSHLNSRISEKGIDLNTERKIEQWRRDMSTEIQVLQSQLQIYRTADDSQRFTEGQLASLIREVHDSKRYVQEECETLRRAVENLKTRMVKMELEMTALQADNKELNRRHDRLDMTIRDVSDHQLTQSRSLNRSLDEKDYDKIQLAELRTTIRSLRDKLGSMEEQWSPQRDNFAKAPEGKGKLKSKAKQKKTKEALLSPDTSDLEMSSSTSLADYSSSDFDTVPKERKKVKEIAYHEELDLELDLSDVPSISTEDLGSD